MIINVQSLIILILIIDSQVMISSKVHQIIPHPTKPQAQTKDLVIGVCDYIPYSLKFKQSLRIAIDGDPHTILNSVLWSQYFYKTLLKQCQQHFLLTYASQGQQVPSAIFIKNREKIYKFEDNLQWNSTLRKDIASSLQRKHKIEIQTYLHTGTMRTISIFFGEYVQAQGIDLLLKLVQTENYTNQVNQGKKIHKNDNPIVPEELKKFATSMEEDKISLRQDMKLSKQSEKSISHFSTLKSKNKGVQTNKQNSKTSKTATEKGSSSVKSRKVLDKKCNNTTIPSASNRRQEQKYAKQQILSLLQERFQPKQSNNGRQRIISKILATKQQALVVLKQRMAKQQLQFEELIREERAQHQQQMHNITQSIKSLLQQYKVTKVTQENQISYLKERVSTLQGALNRRQIESQEKLLQLSTLISSKRQIQQQLKKKCNEIARLKEQYQSQRKIMYDQNKRFSQQMQKAMQKSADYQRKYQNLVSVMRKNLPNCDEEGAVHN